MDPVRRRLLLAPPLALAAGLRAGPAWATTAAPSPDSGTPLALLAAPRATGGGLSYDGSPNGPVLRIVRGATIAVTLTNRLGTPTGLQWHGMRLPNLVDGDLPVMGAALGPGETTNMAFTPPDSGLYWFHPPAMPGLPDQTALGLRGVLVVEEAAPPAVARDLLLTIGDDSAGGATVNGVAAPLRDTIPAGGRLRLRLLNASTSRIMTLTIEGARPKVVAIDGQPSDLFAPVGDSVPVGPGARFEMMMDAPATTGATVRLTRRGIGLGEGPKTPDALLMDLTTAGPPRDPLPPIAALPRNPALPPAIPLEASVRGRAVIEAVPTPDAGAARWRINGVAGLDAGARPLLRVPRGGTVTLGLDNRSSVPVPMRVHGHAVRLLHAKDDGWEPYWRDSVILPPSSVNHVAFVADNPGRWLVESAMFEQAASGLRGWFEVV